MEEIPESLTCDAAFNSIWAISAVDMAYANSRHQRKQPGSHDKHETGTHFNAVLAVARAIQLSSCSASGAIANPCDNPQAQQATPAAPQLIGVSHFAVNEEARRLRMHTLTLKSRGAHCTSAPVNAQLSAAS